MHLAGEANIHFGVLPRYRQSGKASDVTVATCLWADCDRALSAWPEEIPPPSIIVETSPWKTQLYWLLDRATDDLARVERLNRSLAVALSADKAATDRARVLRLPGFPNLKYPECPVSRLVEIHPQRQYSLPDLERRLPHPAEQPAMSERRPQQGRAHQGHEGVFDPHRGGADVPEAMRHEIDHELRRRGLAPSSDGRLTGSCPFPGHTGQSAHNFHFSALSGRWWCFGEHHPGRNPEKTCVASNAWSLWAVLFPVLPSPGRGDETSTSSPPYKHL